MALKFQLRRGSAAQWSSTNPTLAAGEMGIETDTGKAKVGNGTSAWNDLSYFVGGPGTQGTTGSQGTNGTQGIQGITGSLSQYDIGTNPNQIPLNQYLGSLAYLDSFESNNVASLLSSNNIFTNTNIFTVNSTSTALEVRQTGTGLALRVEDSTNPDATPFVVDANGRVGIGLSNPTQALHVVGNVVATGTITASFSDERLKEKLGNVNNSIEIIQTLNGFKYKNNDLAKTFGYGGDSIQIGLSAQEVQNVLPEIVSLAPFDMARDEEDNLISKSGENYLTLDYAKLVPVLIEAVKELKSEIEKIKENK